MADFDQEPSNEEPKPEDQAVVQHQTRSLTPFDADPERFAQQLQRRGDNFKSLIEWLVDNMGPEHFAQIHHVKRGDCEHGGPSPRGKCGPSVCPWHWSDPDLTRKGDELVCGLLGMGVRFPGMQDFRRQALRGVKIEDVIIECELYDGAGNTLSQGTGACSVSETRGNLHNCMTKACKRAQHDAVKRCAGLSGLSVELKGRMPAIDLDQAQAAAESVQHRQISSHA